VDRKPTTPVESAHSSTKTTYQEIINELINKYSTNVDTKPAPNNAMNQSDYKSFEEAEPSQRDLKLQKGFPAPLSTIRTDNSLINSTLARINTEERESPRLITKMAIPVPKRSQSISKERGAKLFDLNTIIETYKKEDDKSQLPSATRFTNPFAISEQPAQGEESTPKLTIKTLGDATTAPSSSRNRLSLSIAKEIVYSQLQEAQSTKNHPSAFAYVRK